MNNQLERIIKLIKKTGDRMVVYNPEAPDDSYVVMSIDEYERFLGDDENLTDEEMTDKINRDIAAWRSEQLDFDSREKELVKSRPQIFSGDAAYHHLEVAKRGGNAWKIPKNIKKAAANSKSIRIDEDEEEKRKYPGIRF